MFLATTRAEPHFTFNCGGGSSNWLDDFAHGLLSAAQKPLLALPIFTGQDGFQIPLKVFKVILCSDFPGFHIVHHFPQRNSSLAGSKCQRELPAAVQARIVVQLPVLYRPRKELSYRCRASCGADVNT